MLNQKELNTISLEDCDKYLRNGIFRVRLPKQKNPCWVSVESSGPADEKDFNIKLRLTDPARVQVFRFKDVKFDMSFFPRQMWNFKGDSLLLTRRTSRQWTRGYHSASIISHNLSWRLAGMNAFPEERAANMLFSTSLVDFASLEEPIAVDKALHSLRNLTCFARAVSSRVSLSQGILGKCPSVWFYDDLVGELEDKRVLMYNPLFFQEISDDLQSQGVTVNA